MESVLHKNLSFLGNNILTLWGGGVRGLSLKITVPLRFSFYCYFRCLLQAPARWLPFSSVLCSISGHPFLPSSHSLTPKLLQFTSPQVGQLCKGLSSDQLGKNW